MNSLRLNLRKAEDLANELAYVGKDIIDTTALYGHELSNLIWSYVDGLQSRYVLDRIEGKASLKHSLDWSLDKCNDQILEDISVMNSLTKVATGKCKNCEHWEPIQRYGDGTIDYMGICLINTEPDLYPSTLVGYNKDVDSGEISIETGKEFGCIHYQHS